MHRIENLKSPVRLLVAFALVAQSIAMAAPKPLEVKWNELGSLVQGRNITLTLPGGVTVGGEVIVVREDTLVLNVHKTSDSRAYPKGNATLPRESVTVVRMTETHGRWGRKMGSGLGTLAGVLAGVYIAGNSASSVGSGLAIFGVIAGAGTLGGYYLGKSADSRDTLIRIVP